MHRQDHHAHVRIALAHLRRGLEAGDSFHGDVHQHDVGPLAVGDLERLLAARGFGDHLHLAHSLQKRMDAGAHQRVVVGEQHADHPTARSFPPAAAMGKVASSTVPCPGDERSSNEPPASAMRSSMPTRPRLAPFAGARAHRIEVEAAAVVAHRDREPAAGGEQAHPQVARARVAQHVVDRFLRDAEARGLGVGRELLRRVLGLEMRLQPGDARLAVEVRAQRRGEPEVVELRRPQAERELAHALERVLHGVDDLVDARARARARRPGARATPIGSLAQSSA